MNASPSNGAPLHNARPAAEAHLVDLARVVLDLPEAERRGALCRIVQMDGFGGRRDGEFLGVLGERRVGSLLGGAIDADLAAPIERAAHGSTSLVEVPVGDRAAVDAGLACGGKALVLVQALDAIPSMLWLSVLERTPVAIATACAVDGSAAPGAVRVRTESRVGDASLGDVDLDALADAGMLRLLQRGKLREIDATTKTTVVLEAFSPDPLLVVLGRSGLADALERQGAMLGWRAQTFDERVVGQTDEALRAVRSFGPSDAVVVLSHDIEASCRVLEAGLSGRCGYLGALGSRHTQAARFEHLTQALGVPADAAQRVHGPVGFDIGARTPEETAVAVFAEILANRSGRTGASLRSTGGPIN